MKKPDKQPKAPTMADVAKLAGVSQMTVSRALREGTSASMKTRCKIIAAADELGYVIDSTASNFASRRTGFVAMTIPTISDVNFATTARAVADTLREGRLELLLGYTNYDLKEEEHMIESLLRRRPEAIIVTGGNHTDRCRRLLASCGAPVIETWDLPPEPIGHSVGFSNAQAGRDMADHLHQLGYKKCAFIGGDAKGDARGVARRAGFLERLRSFGVNEERVLDTGGPSMRHGAAAMRSLLERWPDTDAVMCVCDTTAFGALTACQRMGIDTPQDIAIAGFGAQDIAEYALPQITTIDVNAYQMGAAAAKLLRKTLDEPERSGPVCHPVSFNLLARASTMGAARL